MPLAQAPPHAQIPGSLPYGGSAASATWPQVEHFFSDVFGASAADAVFSDLAAARPASGRGSIAAAQAENVPASLPPVAASTQAACSSPSSLDDERR